MLFNLVSVTPGEAFEKGAGFSLADINGLFTESTVLTVFIFISWGILSAYLAWRNGKSSFAELGGTVFYSLFFLVILITFIAVVSTTSTFK
ncbi:MAG: DUF3262 family protein [Alteromonadales bacterium]|nr:DUF3262 family protein [Alteromonadales bacterium]MCP4987469.1 DUF3262 family protein [Colwellia sp.]